MTTAQHSETPTRDARLDFRLQREHKQLIEQAAVASGQSVSEFALSHLIEAAQGAVERATTTQLTRRDREEFLSLIMEDAEPNSALRAAARRYRSGGA